MPLLLLLFLGGPDLGWEELFVQITVEPVLGQNPVPGSLSSALHSDKELGMYHR